MNNFKKKYIGDKAFYKRVLLISVPMILQNLITNFVSMLDNIMVGRVGTPEMTGVSIVNQLIFVFNITIFGAVSGAGIFGTQFFGKGDHEGQKYTVRFRIIMAVVLFALAAIVFNIFGSDLINLFISEKDELELRKQTLKFGEDYLNVMIIGLIPFALGQVYASVVRECGETKIPMIGSMAAIGVNLILDYGLIFGKLGMPKMGVVGAAIATVVAKTIEAAVVIIWAHTHKEKNKYIVGLYKGFYIPGKLMKNIIIKGTPLLFNEFLWSLGMSIIAQCYSIRGLDVVAARNIASTLTNLFSVVFIQLGHATGIIVGALLGANKLEEAKDNANKMIFFSVVANLVIAILIIPPAFVFPNIYNTTNAIRQLSTFFIVVQAIAMPLWAYTNSTYFILRSGGKTGITFLFDFVYTWAVMIPLAFVLTHFTNMEIHLLITIVIYSEIFKVIVGYFMIKSGIWINNIVSD